MQKFRHLPGVTTLALDPEACVGCGVRLTVCPHGVLDLREGRAVLMDRDACMECGACALNCPTQALTVTPGVGCAAYIIQTWLKGRGVKTSGCC